MKWNGISSIISLNFLQYTLKHNLKSNHDKNISPLSALFDFAYV